jgi:transketolase
MIAPQALSSRLAPRPTGLPRYPVSIRKADGTEIFLADPKANRAMVALMNAQAIFGGAAAHWGGPSALAEIMSAVHGILFESDSSPKEWYERYHFVNDAGHTENGVYALRANLGFDHLDLEALKGFRSIDSKLTGHGESHLNPEGVLLSNGPLGSAVAQAQGLAMADKLANIDRATFLIVSDGAAMEGEAREAFASIPGFAQRSQLNPFVMIVSDNNTKLSGRIDADSFDMRKTFATLSTLGWNVIDLHEAHDLQATYLVLTEALETARNNPTQPICVWARTIKGFGLNKTATAASGGHGFPNDMAESVSQVISELYADQVIPEEFKTWAQAIETSFADKKAKPATASPAIKKEKVQVGLAKGMIQAAEKGLPVVCVSSDLQGSTGVAPFHKAFPAQSFDVGVAEANMISVAAGFSKMGFLPVVDTFAQFGVTKGNLPFAMASISQAPVIAAFSHVGFQDAADGASHQASTYFSAVSSIPDVIAIALSCSAEAESLMQQAFERQLQAKKDGKHAESVLFFLGREDFPQHYGNTDFSWGKAQVLRQGKDAVVVAAGHMVVQALEAAEQLKQQGIDITVIQNAFVNRPDTATISEQLQRNNNLLVTLEDHQARCGMGAQLIHALAVENVNFRVKSLGIKDHFGHSAYKAQELYDRYGMGTQDVIQAVKGLF